MNELEKRKEAIRLLLSHEIVTTISKILKRSRAWIYKWYNRYKGDPLGSWYEDESRRPKQSKKKFRQTQKQKLYPLGSS